MSPELAASLPRRRVGDAYSAAAISVQFGLLSTQSHQTVELSVITEDAMLTTCDKRAPRTGVHAFSRKSKQILNTFGYKKSDLDSTDCAMFCRCHVSRCSLHADLVK